MKLLLNDETERHLAASLPAAKNPGVADYMLDDVGKWMTTQGCSALFAGECDYERAYRQSVGSFVIVQTGTEEKREVWNAAIDKCREEANAMLLEAVRLELQKSNTCRAAFAERPAGEDEWTIVFVDDLGNQLTFDEAKESLYPDLAEKFRGPFAKAEHAQTAVDNFIEQEPSCAYFPDANGGVTIAH